VPIKQAPQLLAVADIHPSETIVGVARCLWNRVQVGGVGELVDVDDIGLSLVELVPDHGGPDEARATRDEKCSSAKPHGSEIRKSRLTEGTMDAEQVLAIAAFGTPRGQLVEMV
jgi:hypothetical protein